MVLGICIGGVRWRKSQEIMRRKYKISDIDVRSKINEKGHLASFRTSPFTLAAKFESLMALISNI
jgi:hypothetical protein